MVRRTWVSRTFPGPRQYSIAIILSVAVTAGCGGGSGESSESDAIPAELVGTYTTTLREADLPTPVEDEFAECGLKWKMTITRSGGPDGGPVLTLFNRDFPGRCGRLEGPSLRIDGDTLLLKNEECEQKVGFLFYDNEYGWKLDGETLTLTTVKNQCAEGSAETILTSQPWTKQ